MIPLRAKILCGAILLLSVYVIDASEIGEEDKKQHDTLQTLHLPRYAVPAYNFDDIQKLLLAYTKFPTTITTMVIGYMHERIRQIPCCDQYNGSYGSTGTNFFLFHSESNSLACSKIDTYRSAELGVSIHSSSLTSHMHFPELLAKIARKRNMRDKDVRVLIEQPILKENFQKICGVSYDLVSRLQEILLNNNIEVTAIPLMDSQAVEAESKSSVWLSDMTEPQFGKALDTVHNKLKKVRSTPELYAGLSKEEQEEVDSALKAFNRSPLSRLLQSIIPDRTTIFLKKKPLDIAYMKEIALLRLNYLKDVEHTVTQERIDAITAQFDQLGKK